MFTRQVAGRCALGAFLTAAGACGGDDSSAPQAQARDAGPVADGGVRLTLSTSDELVDGNNSEAILGDPMDIVVLPDGTPALVYGAVPVGQTSRVLRYAERAGPDDWVTEEALVPGTNQLGLEAVSAGYWEGAVHIAFRGGDDDNQDTTPYPTDLMLATRTGPQSWTQRVLVDTSGEAAGDCPDLQNYCNFGNVVGSYASVAVGGRGRWAVSYQDTHRGLGFEDRQRADVEVYVSDDRARLVDAERGGGAWGRVAFLPDGRLALAYVVDSEFSGRNNRGTWVAIDDGRGGFRREKVSDQVTTHRLGFAAGPMDNLWLAWYEPSNQDLVVGSSGAPFTQWTVETVDSSGYAGLHPSLVLTPGGAPYIAYGYCGPLSDRGCPGNPGSRAEVRLARRPVGSTEWLIDTIADGEGRGGIGFFNRLAFLGEGQLAVAYQDSRNSDVLVTIVNEGNQ